MNTIHLHLEVTDPAELAKLEALLKEMRQTVVVDKWEDELPADSWDALPPALRKSLERGMQDAAAGRTHSLEDIMALFPKWTA